MSPPQPSSTGASAGAPEVLELSDVEPTEIFDPSKFIGVGQTYPDSNVPDFISAEKKKLLDIPSSFIASHVPPGSTPVVDFVKLPIPRQSFEFTPVRVTDMFSSDSPNVDTKVLMTRTIPRVETLRALSTALGQAWFDGKKSIIDWRFNDGRDRLPFWAISFWYLIADVSKKQAAWKRGLEWVNGLRVAVEDDVTCGRAEEAFAELSVLGWDIRNPFLNGATTSAVLADFLGVAWLSDEHINMMFRLSDRVKSDPTLRDRVLVRGLDFSNPIADSLGDNGKGWEHHGSLKSFVVNFTMVENQYELIVFPVHVGGSHWITGCINLKENFITYARDLAPPMRFLKQLQAFLQNSPLRRKMSISMDALPHGIQSDSYSCGICAENTAAHAIFGSDTPLWIQRLRDYSRIGQFLIFSRSCPPSSRPSSPEPCSRPSSPGPSSRLSSSVPSSWPSSPAPSTRPSSPAPSSRPSSPAPSSRPSSPAPSSRRSLSSLFKRSLSSAASTRTSSPAPSLASRLSSSFFSPFKGKGSHKRPPPSDSSSSGGSEYGSDEGDGKRDKKGAPKAKLRKTNKGKGKGTSRTAIRERENRKKINNGTFEYDEDKLERWRNYIIASDPDVQFNPKRITAARHSGCHGWVIAKREYSRVEWDQHVAKCTKKTRTIYNMFGKAPPRMKTTVKVKQARPEPPPPPEPVEVPCPGLTSAQIEKYLARSMASGGGAPSESKLAKRYFKKPYRDLTDAQKEDIAQGRITEQMWRNEHSLKRVFSTTCTGTVTYIPLPGATPPPCQRCRAVRKLPAFRTAIRRPAPEGDRWKYTPKRFSISILGEIFARHRQLHELFTKDAESDPFVRYALGSLKGEYDNTVFTGLMEAMVTKLDKKSRGVGMQNFRYAPAYDELMQILWTQSPSTARLLSTHLPMRSERSFRYKLSREPKLPLDFCKVMFERVSRHLAALGCMGEPVCLQVDDTKLFKKLRMYYVKKEDAYYVVGACEGPIRVARPEELEAMLRNKEISPSSKMRLFLVQVTTQPKSLPVVVAAKPLPENADAPFLLQWTLEIIRGLLAEGVNIVSYACDGTEVERAVQRLLVDSSESGPLVRTLRSDDLGAPETLVQMALIDGHPIAVIQDTKHALKTLRNNLFSGARALVLGNHFAGYQHIHDLAHEAGSPIFVRDVVKLDRQDDNAAKRLTSADTLEFIIARHPDYVGVIVYLYVAGELVDAYQSRSLSHTDRLRMVLTTLYFVESWIAFLQLSQYDLKHYCISREALDIIRIHTFGDARRIQQDFTYLDFLYFVPKIAVSMRNTILHMKLTSDKATASGYNHTYFDTRGLSLAVLMQFPDDVEISHIATEAREQCDSLIRVLGIDPVRLRVLQGISQRGPATLPSLQEWFPRREDIDRGHAWDRTRGWTAADESDEEDDGGVWDDDVAPISAGQRLQDILDEEEAYRESRNTPLRPALVALEIQNLTCAAMALTAGEMARVASLNSCRQNIINEDNVNEEDVLAAHASDLQSPSWLDIPNVHTDDPSQPVGLGGLGASQIDLQVLADIRRVHQTRQAADGVRSKVARARQTAEESARRKILRRFDELLGLGAEQGVGTGLVRKAHHTEDGKESEASTAGNAANAAVVSKQSIAQALTRRRKIFAEAGLPAYLGDARVNSVNYLSSGSSMVFIFAPEKAVAVVLALYEKTAGKNGKHAGIATLNNVAAVSYAVVQVFSVNRDGLTFSSIAARTSLLGTKAFLHLPPSHILSVLQHPAAHSSDGDVLTLHDNDLTTFKELRANIARIDTACRRFKQRRRADNGQ
ncbi:hypothetical protein FB107DRAFT_222515 [Schizophyllum commune]